ncbi:MAG TPA: ABC transporter substrate-binding protein [Longimicrobium sp.]|uniref:ABC transporter substrate-binding protein n=1 Tax=Longimicrobium sp. TaxID=2029185 RepID=UPI002EDA4035
MTRIRLAPSLAALLALAAACGPGSPAEQRARLGREGKGDITVAAVWPFQARGEIRFAEGLQMAVEEVNASGGIHGRRIKLRMEDDRGSVNDGLLVAQKLADDPSVAAVIGHLNSYVTVPAASVYDAAGMVLVAPASTDPELTSKGYGRVFRIIPTDQQTGRQMADYASRHGMNKVAIYYVRNSYGRALANAFEERAATRGVTVEARASYAPEARADGRTFAPVLEQWKDMELDAIFLAGQVPQAGYLVAEARRLGITVPILGNDAMSSPALVQGGGAAVEGTVVPSPFHASEPRGEVQRFASAFERRYHAEADPGAALGYDAVMVLAQAMRTARSAESADVSAALRALRAQGVTGALAFDGRGDLAERQMVKMVVRGGQFRYLSEALARADR